MSATIITIIVAVISSQAIFGFIQFIITRRDTKNSIDGKLVKMERDILRTQLLLLVLLKPEEDQEILMVAEHYFHDLKGDWYMTSIFNKWLADADIAEPEWFDNTK